ncbi:LysE family translocator [Duganella callida]|uniref:LysE family translocator n=1 Tax=Duganella callida TaxID=2561932 RepID=A0A4Y9SMQ9_9BURK|nr:LysE family translocator [Duganella callida]TFW23874.1 LysE family translocator [Duganella callida]
MFGIHDLTLFIISGLLLNLMPGPDNLLIMTRTAMQGWRAGSAATLGIGLGTMVHVLAAALGLSAVLSTSAAAFTVVKWIGAAYIVYMGIGMLHAKLRNAGDDTTPSAMAARAGRAAKPLAWRTIFFQGFLSNALNPKVALFFLAFVPQFIAADSGNKPLAFIILGCIFNINGMLYCHALVAFTAFASARLNIKPVVSLWLNRTMGGLFLALGMRLALSEQH